ncbi:PASTA domain-containing protein [Nonomuraea sp. NPDC050790]|uniref:PASTA domain-containing protein n=1 Tax=Nonomuraea sp. NPDC050790 TaxID=3364371 RepID=UPI00379220CC
MTTLRRLAAAGATASLGTALLTGTAAAQNTAHETAQTAAPVCVTNNGVRFCEMPDIVGMGINQARATLGTYGFSFGIQRATIDHVCNNIGLIARQSPRSSVGSSPLLLYPAGTAVDVWIWQRPPHPCP